MVTPVSPVGVVLGKLLPYLVLGFVQLIVILTAMTLVFRVPIHGNVFLLLGLSLVYLFALLSMALVVSASSATQMEAIQRAQTFLLPSIMLSGYVFPIESMPPFFIWLAYALPTTWMIDVSRGVILRGAGWEELRQHALVLSGMALVLLVLSMTRFRKRLS